MAPAARPGPASDSGLTLLEMLVVIAVLLLVGAALAGFGGGGTGVSHDRVADRLVDTLREARAAAIATGRPVAVRLDPKGAAYGLGRMTALPDGMALSWRTLRDARTDGTPAIRFFPDGSSSGGILRLTGPRGQDSRIEVRWITGRVVRDAP